MVDEYRNANWTMPCPTQGKITITIDFLKFALKTQIPVNRQKGGLREEEAQ